MESADVKAIVDTRRVRSMKPDLDEGITALYAGALDTFVARRDALVKELRANGQREAVATVKNLRKPARIAWALDLGVLGTPHAMQALDTALNETLSAHSGSGDVRTAMTGLRNAVRELAAHAARAAEREGLPVEAAVLANALNSMLGTHDSMQLLRRGWLTDVPENDGLDFLAALPPAPIHVALPNEGFIAEARARSRAAQQKLRDAEARLTAAEELLREAEVAATTMRAEIERARQQAETAAAELRDLETARSSHLPTKG